MDNNVNYEHLNITQQNIKYSSFSSKLKEKINQLFYYHGLSCSRHPYLLIIFSILLFIFCCYPIFGLHLFQNDFSQQFITDLDTFRDLNFPKNSSYNLNETFNDDKIFSNGSSNKKILKKAPVWFNRAKPCAYVMQILVQSAVMPWKENLILMDAIRAPIAQVFSIVELISNFQLKYDEQFTTLNDVCLQVAEPIHLKDEIEFSYLPRYSCLVLSPANVWKNDVNKFLKDSEIIKTIFDIKDTSSLESGSLKELLFGLSWIQTGIRKLYVRTRQRTINYAITLVFKEYNEKFIENLKLTLKKKFPGTPFIKDVNKTDLNSINNDILNKKVVHLYFQNQKNFTEFIPLAITYFLVFIIIYFSVQKIDLIKNKFILAVGSVLTIALSLFISIGICFWLEFNPTLNGSDILPYLVVLLSVENILIITKSVTSTPYHLDMKVRMAQGLSKEASTILSNFSVIFILFLLGFLTFIPLIQDICLFGIVAIFSDLLVQFLFFSPILANNIKKTSKLVKGHKKNLSSSKPITWTLKNSNSEIDTKRMEITSQSPTKVYARPSTAISQEKTPKRLRFFYFIANQRIIHKFLILTFIIWILILSFGTFTFKVNKNKINSEINQNSFWNFKSLNDFTLRDKLTIEKHQFTKNKFLFSHFLSCQHWSTLFWSYNISLSGKYITILPALQLSIRVDPEKAIETRHSLESDPQIFRQYLFPGLKKIQPSESFDDYEDEILYKNIEFNQWSKKSLIFTSILMIITFFILIYLLTSLYKCVCSRQYAEWRSSLFKKDKMNLFNGKDLENLVMEALPITFKAHQQEIEYLYANISSQIVISCDLQGDIKIWDILSGECKTFICRSNYKNADNKTTSLNKSSLLNKSSTDEGNNSKAKKMNNFTKTSSFKNQENGYDFSKFYDKANFSTNFLSKFIQEASQKNSIEENNEDFSCFQEADNHVFSELEFQSIWSVFLLDKLVYIGCSEGRIEVWHVNSGELCFYNESCDSGITVINANNQKLFIARLNGFVEVYDQELKANNGTCFSNYFSSKENNFNNRNVEIKDHTSSKPDSKSLNYITFKYLQTINAHKQPITCLKLEGKYMLTGSSDHLVRVFKLEQFMCSSLFTLHGHFGGITCLEIDRSSNSAVSGCQLGQVCVWDLITGACIFSLEAHNGTITDILITSLYIISSSIDNKINIWDKYSGNLINTINYQHSMCQKIVIMASNILVTVNDDELHLWDISEAKKIKIVKLAENQNYSLIRNLGLSFKSRVIVCDYGTYLCFVHFPGIMQKFD